MRNWAAQGTFPRPLPRSRSWPRRSRSCRKQPRGGAPEPDKVLAAIPFSNIVGSTARAAELGDARWRQLLAEHHVRVRRQLARFRGVELDTAGDGFFARFDGPARGIRCAVAIREALRDLGLEVRLGLHTGECEELDGKIAGIAVSIGARVSALAAAGEVLVSQTVKDLVAGSGITFADGGVAAPGARYATPPAPCKASSISSTVSSFVADTDANAPDAATLVSVLAATTSLGNSART